MTERKRKSGKKTGMFLLLVVFICVLPGFFNRSATGSIFRQSTKTILERMRQEFAANIIPVAAYDYETQCSIWDNGGILLWMTGFLSSIGYVSENSMIPIFHEDNVMLYAIEALSEEEPPFATQNPGKPLPISNQNHAANPDQNLYFENQERQVKDSSDLAMTGQNIENMMGPVTGTDGRLLKEKRLKIYDTNSFYDIDYLMEEFYLIDSTTSLIGKDMSKQNLLETDLTLEKDGEGPHILIYHTHSQEGFIDSNPADPSTTIVGVGEYLAKLLTERYGFSVIHHTGCYDVEDRDRAYSLSGPAVTEILQTYPGIDVVIDLHRDGVNQSRHLVTQVNGKQTAQFMFFNGLSYTDSIGDIDYLPNPYIKENMAFSFQMQMTCNEFYPGLARKIYLKGYRYNMHLCPKTLLVELGAQTNTIEEAKNACEPLSAVLAYVLEGKNREP